MSNHLNITIAAPTEPPTFELDREALAARLYEANDTANAVTSHAVATGGAVYTAGISLGANMADCVKRLADRLASGAPNYEFKADIDYLTLCEVNAADLLTRRDFEDMRALAHSDPAPANLPPRPTWAEMQGGRQ